MGHASSVCRSAAFAVTCVSLAVDNREFPNAQEMWGANEVTLLQEDSTESAAVCTLPKLAQPHQVIETMMQIMTTGEMAELSPVESEALRAIVLAAPMARRKNAVVQFFSRFWNVPSDPNRKFFTTENVASESQAISTADIHMMDMSISEAIFDKPFRMNEDFLSESIAKELDAMCPPDTYCENMGLHGRNTQASSLPSGTTHSTSLVELLALMIAAAFAGAAVTITCQRYLRPAQQIDDIDFTELDEFENDKLSIEEEGLGRIG